MIAAAGAGVARQATRIERVRVLAQDGALLAPALPDDPRLIGRAVGRRPSPRRSRRSCADPATRWPLLVTTADHALLDGAMIDDFCARGGGRRRGDRAGRASAPLMARLPQTKRTWIGFRGGAYSGANLFALGIAQGGAGGGAVARGRAGSQEGLEAARRARACRGCSGWLRLRTLDQTLAAMGRKLGLDHSRGRDGQSAGGGRCRQAGRPRAGRQPSLQGRA